MPRANRPEHRRTNAIRSRWRGSMFAWILNTKAENVSASGATVPVEVGRSRGGRALAVVDAHERLAGSDGPVHGRARDAQDALDLVEQLERRAAGAVQLVDERHDRDAAHAAHGE